MPNVTFQIPEEIKKILSKHPEIEWNKIVADVLWSYGRKLSVMDKITSKSKLNNKDIEELNKAIKTNILHHYKK